MQRIQSEVPGLTGSGFQPLMIAGSLIALLGVLCLIFNKKLGGWIGRSSLTVFGTRASEQPDEIIFRGLACVLGLLYLGVGGMFLASAFK